MIDATLSYCLKKLTRCISVRFRKEKSRISFLKILIQFQINSIAECHLTQLEMMESGLGPNSETEADYKTCVSILLPIKSFLS
jgi:hypothetical protein